MTILSRLFLLAAFALAALPVAAQSPIGTWRTIDDETGEAKSHIEIYQTDNGRLEGKIVRVLRGDGPCDTCEGQYAGKPLAGVVILRGLKFDGDGEWDGGKITDPQKDKTYNAEIKLDGPDRLEVRGYVGKGIFSIGRTQTWERVDS